MITPAQREAAQRALAGLQHDDASAVYCCPDCGLHLLLMRKNELCPAKVARRIAELEDALETQQKINRGTKGQ